MKAYIINVFVLIFLAIPVIVSGFVSCTIVKHLDKLGSDGWKRLFSLHKTLINFYIIVFMTCIIEARYINILGDQLFVALLIASATALGIKLGIDMKKKED